MRAVGFDIRNENCVVGVIKPTPILCIDEEQRFLGIAGAATSTENPRNSISLIMRLIIGRSFSDPELQQDLKSLPFSVTEGRDGFPLIHALYHGETKSFTPIQVMGMAFVESSTINARANLAYGIQKNDLSENKQLNVAFVDIGHFSMQVCIAGFKKGEMKILAHSFDRRLGGRDFDEVLFHLFAEKFKADYKINVLKNANVCIKFRVACEKLKEVLKSNPEAPLYVECFIDERYFRGFIKRDEYEQISKPVFERIKKPLEKALFDAQLTVDDIHDVELIGSDSWVPVIIKILTEFFGKEPSTIDANECVSKGCALECAILGPYYNVREFQVQEIFPFSIALQRKSLSQDSCNGETDNRHSCTIVFPKVNLFPCVKVLTFYRASTFTLDVQYADANELAAPSKINTYTIGPFQSTNGEGCKVKVKILLNLNGCVSVESAQFSEEVKTIVQIPVSMVEPLKETTKMAMEKGLTDVEVDECMPLPNT